MIELARQNLSTYLMSDCALHYCLAFLHLLLLTALDIFYNVMWRFQDKNGKHALKTSHVLVNIA